MKKRFRSLNKTRDKLSFFYSETSQFLYLVAFLVACARFSHSRDVAKIKQSTVSEKRRAILNSKRYCTVAVQVKAYGNQFELVEIG